MNIYFACSLTGGRNDEAVYGTIVGHLEQSGHEVPTAHLADPGIMELERVVDPDDVYQRDVNWIQGSEVLIAEVSTPSHGVGYEIGYALNLGRGIGFLGAELTNVNAYLDRLLDREHCTFARPRQ